MWIGAACALAFVAGSVGYVKHLDLDNRFCIACHLHEDLYRHTVSAPPATLAAAHYRARPAGHPERCFTCHSGEGLGGWSKVTLLSAWDAARWVAGDRHEPTSMRLPLENRACLKCHTTEVHGTKSQSDTGKYHELRDHRGVGIPCFSCHVTHKPGVRSRTYLDEATVRARCQGCHRDLEAL